MLYESMVVNKCVAVGNQQTAAGWSYSLELLRKISGEFKECFGTIGDGFNDGVKLDLVTHVVNSLFMDGNYLVANIKTMPNHLGCILKTLINDVTFNLMGFGSVSNKQADIKTYQLSSINAYLIKDVSRFRN